MSNLKTAEAARFAFVDAVSEAGFLIVRDFEHLHMLADQPGTLGYNPVIGSLAT